MHTDPLDDRDRLRHLLGERVKELTALHDAARVLEDDTLDVVDLLDRILALLPPAFQFPGATEARVRYGDVVRSTARFSESHPRLTDTFVSRDGTAGGIDVVYVGDFPSADEGPFLREERHLIDSLTEMLRSALDRRSADGKLQHSAREVTSALALAQAERDRARFLLDLANAVTSQLNLGDLIRTISRLLRENVRHHYISVTLWDDEAQQLRRHALVFPAGTGTIQEGALVHVGAPSDLVHRAGVERMFRWADIQALGEPSSSVMQAEGLRSVYCVPLRTRLARLGTLNVARPDDGSFSDEEVALLQQVARQLAIAIENALHFERAERYRREASSQRDRLRFLLDLANTLASELSLSPLVGKISALLHTALPYKYTSVLLWDAQAQQLRRHVVVFAGEVPNAPEGELVPDDHPSAVVFREGKATVFRQSAPRDSVSSELMRVAAERGLGSGCGVPLETARGRHGVMFVAVAEDRAFEADEIALLEQIARQLAIAVESALAYQEISDLKDRLTEEKLYLEDEITLRGDFKGIVGNSRALSSVLQQVRTVAPTDATVLLLGETGTGKEVLARAIHDASRRQHQTFVRVNAAALPAGLVESELFGYEKGAFTGAVSSKVGRLELAHRGTMFLDEVGDLPLEVQPKLLRAFQEHEFERLGGTRTQRVDVRLIAATNRNLEEMVASGAFRSDLYYRLSVFPIVVPPLRERPEDIPSLVSHFANKFSRELGRGITTIAPDTMKTLQAWHWPGNIRELQNVVERAVILSPGPSLEVPAAAFRSSSIPARAARVDANTTRADADTTLSATEREAILKALRDARGVIGGPEGAAARLGLKRTTLHSKMRKLGIARPSY